MGDPRWRENVLEAYRQKTAELKRSGGTFGRALRPLQLSATLTFISFIDRAAKGRNVNRSTYYRRAAAVMAAHDLGIDIRPLLFECPAPGPFGVQQMRLGSHRDLGEGIEDWCPHPGCNGEHLTDPT